MFKLHKPCNDCPFRKCNGQRFRLRHERLREIFTSDAFQCHKTSEDKPQQCAGLIILLDKEGMENTITQIAIRLGEFDLSKLEDRDQVYDTIEDAIIGHTKEDNYDT